MSGEGKRVRGCDAAAEDSSSRRDLSVALHPMLGICSSLTSQL